MNKTMGLIRLIRPINCIMMGLATVIGGLLVSSPTYRPIPLLLGFITGFALTGSSMVINDYYDRFVDAVNEPNRPIPSKQVMTREAILYAIFLGALGLTSAFLIHSICFVTALILFFVSLIYNVWGKELGFIGNILVSSCVAIPFVYGGLIYSGDGLGKNFELLIFFASMSFLSNMGREITKGIVDVDGDVIRGVYTVAISHGSRFASFFAALFYLSAVVLSTLPWLYHMVSWVYVPIVFVTDLGLVFSSFLLVSNYSKENAKKVKTTVLIWMLFGLLAFITGGLIEVT